eukprot:TRINITY_DN1711_c1_g1_i2.p1 TRINITY_DN1711_c1_g1~~TRINITY_DN1711_c1_g1_i2.p1  ORF type:complete len:369 (+),score=126.68 TRINITY_DN1711_c1_g1_i2:293-1399(+)
MAKYGEGDARWIVQERADGTNVHNWHWAEKDCLPWATRRLEELLEGQAVLSGEGGMWVKISKVDSVEGEAYVNIRKGKIIPGYELKVRLSWEGEARADDRPLFKADGKVELPYVADENRDEEPDVRVSVNDESSSGQRLKEVMLVKGKKLVLEKVSAFVKEISEGGPAKDELKKAAAAANGKAAQAEAVGAAASAAGATKSTDKSAAAAAAAAAGAKKEQKKETAGDAGGKRTLSMVQQFHCRAADIYGMLLDERRWMGFTQSAAKISPEVGGVFSFFDGAVTGVTQKLEENRLIVQKWRSSSWADGSYSTVCITIEEPEIGCTVVKLTQTSIPEEDRFGNATVFENTERGWRELIFHKIRAVFGYGL